MRRHLSIAVSLATTCAGCAAVPSRSVGPVCHYRGSGLFVEPDHRCTPGAISPLVTQPNVYRTICRPGGYTFLVRPPASVTEPQKAASMAAYGDSESRSRFEYDHLVPLSLGGAPDDGRNLWPEPNYPAVSPGTYVLNPKDDLEARLHDLVCAGELPLPAAQRTIARDWVGAYRSFVR